jgi:hypothetical protein
MPSYLLAATLCRGQGKSFHHDEASASGHDGGKLSRGTSDRNSWGFEDIEKYLENRLEHFKAPPAMKERIKRAVMEANQTGAWFPLFPKFILTRIRFLLATLQVSYVLNERDLSQTVRRLPIAILSIE